jgi:hypothetical protein
VNTNEGTNFESIALADQVLKDRRYLITKHYFSEIADGTFQTWRDLLYTDEGIFSDVYEEINLLTRQVWNYSYFKTIFAVDDFHLDTTLARVFNDPSTSRVHAEGLAQWQWQRPPLIFLHPTCLGTMKNLSWC